MGAPPLFLRCPVERRGPGGRHVLLRTGETKPSTSRRGGGRSLLTRWQFECSCGHVGWTTNPGIIDRPLVDGVTMPWRPIAEIPRGGGFIELRDADGQEYLCNLPRYYVEPELREKIESCVEWRVARWGGTRPRSSAGRVLSMSDTEYGWNAGRIRG